MKSENRNVLALTDLILWVIIITVILVTATVVKCQVVKEPLHPTKHKETIEQQEQIRVMFITVTGKNGNQILFYRTGSKLIEVSFLFWDEKSVYKDPDIKQPNTFKGCYLVLICLQHAYTYWLQRTACSDDTGSFYFN